MTSNDDSRFIDLKKINREMAEGAFKQILSDASFLPVRITIETTNACNLRCPMCQIHRPVIPVHFSIERIYSIAEEIFPTLRVLHPTTLGEPLCYPEFSSLIDLLRQYNVKLDLTTNGTLFTADWSALLLPLLEDVKFSVDAADPNLLQRIRPGVDWDTLFANIRDFLSLRKRMFPQRHTGASPTCSFQMTLMKQNYLELPAMVTLASELGIDAVRAYHLLSFSDAMNHQSLIELQDEYNAIVTRTIELAQQTNIIVKLANPFINTLNMENKAWRVGKVRPCPLLWRESWIDLNGDVLPCANPSRPVMGNVFRQSFQDIWNGPGYRKLRQSFTTGEFLPMCRGCGYCRSIPRDLPVPYDVRNFLFPQTYHPDYHYPLRMSSRTAQLLNNTRSQDEVK